MVFIPAVFDKCGDFGFPIIYVPWLGGDGPRLPSYCVYISQLVRFDKCCTSVLDFRSKIFKSFQTTDTGLHLLQASKNIWKVLQLIL